MNKKIKIVQQLLEEKKYDRERRDESDAEGYTAPYLNPNSTN